MESFGQSFIRGIAGAYDLDDAVVVGLSSTLRERLQRARERWPGVQVSGEDFAEHLARCAPESSEPLEALLALHTDDLYLALACSRGDQKAMAALESEVLVHAPRAIARVDSSEAFVSEAVEDVRVKLLVGGEVPARIASYSGRGPLTSWVMVTAIRVAYDLKRKRHQEVPSDQPGLDLAFDDEPELRLLGDQIKRPFAVAFRSALGALDAKDRNILRLYLMEDVSAEAIGKMYGVHRATVARWITSARSAVHKGTRVRLRAELKISDDTFDSLMRHLSSRLDVSLVSSLMSSDVGSSGVSNTFPKADSVGASKVEDAS